MPRAKQHIGNVEVSDDAVKQKAYRERQAQRKDHLKELLNFFRQHGHEQVTLQLYDRKAWYHTDDDILEDLLKNCRDWAENQAGSKQDG
jgi:hypothetical protein